MMHPKYTCVLVSRHECAVPVAKGALERCSHKRSQGGKMILGQLSGSDVITGSYKRHSRGRETTR